MKPTEVKRIAPTVAPINPRLTRRAISGSNSSEFRSVPEKEHKEGAEPGTRNLNASNKMREKKQSKHKADLTQ